MHEERVEVHNGAGWHFERHEAARVEGARVHFTIAQPGRLLAFLYAFAMRAGCNFEATVSDVRFVEEQHCSRDARGDVGERSPVRIVLVKDDRAAVTCAFEVDLL